MAETVVLLPLEQEGAWECARVVQALPGGRALVEVDGARKTVSLDRAVPGNPSHEVDDMAALPHLGEPQLVHALGMRYAQGSIYTACGPSLLAVNPWRPLPLYTEETLQLYREVSRAGSLATRAPHVFGVAATALRAMSEDDSDQTVIVSGESGAGKSESARLLLRALLGCTAPASGGGDPSTKLREVVLQAMELLEPFGSAHTRRNPQSSRFGRMLSLALSAGTLPTISSASIECYLLERSRVTTAPEGERAAGRRVAGVR